MMAIGLLVLAVLVIGFAVGYTKLLKEVLIREFNKGKGE